MKTPWSIVLNFENRVVGIVVDGVSDVLSLSQDQIRPAAGYGGDHVDGMPDGAGFARRPDVELVDIEKLLSSEEIGLVQSGSSDLSLESRGRRLAAHTGPESRSRAGLWTPRSFHCALSPV